MIDLNTDEPTADKKYLTPQDSTDLFKLSQQELDSRLKEIDAEISMFERVHDLEQSTDQQPPVSHFERREFNWNIGWENFYTNLQKSCDSQVELFKKENETYSYLALAKVYENCGDEALLEEYFEKAKLCAFEYGYLLFDPSGNDLAPVKFDNDLIQKEFADGWGNRRIHNETTSL